MASEIPDDESRKIAQEPNWLTGDPKLYPVSSSPYAIVDIDNNKKPLQQSELLKPLLMDIAKDGLPYTYAKFFKGDPNDFKCSKTTKPKKVIIIGAGIAGLVSAFELQRAGHEVEILEMTERVGGRVKTFGEKQGFAKDLFVEGGAMRLPGRPNDPEKIHFLTDFYAKKFELPLLPFYNSDKNAFLKFYNEIRMTYPEWDANAEANFDKLWRGWNGTLDSNGCTDIKDIGAYYDATTGVITDLLRKRLKRAKGWVKQAEAWQLWIKNWSQFTMDGFLRSKYKAIITMVSVQDGEDLEPLKKLLPWPQAAINAYSVFTYTVALDTSLVAFLREDLGKWWSPNMHHIDGGMSKLPNAFVNETVDDCGRESYLLPKVTFNVTVRKVEFTSYGLGPDLHKKVVVSGSYTTSGREFSIEGNAVIVTVPLNIVRQIKFVPGVGTTPLPTTFQQSIEDVWYGPSTKIMIQCKKRFWEDLGIKGGFTKTNLPIGQIHYPTNSTGKSLADERGILLCYTWKSEALLFGSLPPKLAIEEAVRELAEIHPEITDNYEVGAVQAWYSDPSSQGAYALLKPGQYENVLFLMLWPYRNIYFAGEAISFSSGWIQGALESGLRAAYEFYARNEGLKI